MGPKAVRLVTFAWGEQHVKDMLNCALASALAPGNLPAIAREFDCTVAVVTEAALFDLVCESETGRRIQKVCTLKLIPLDDLLAEPWQYGMTLTRALFRGMEDLGPAMTETYFLFLNADFILSEGCYERLIPRIRAGERLHLSPSYCTVEEAVAPILLGRLKNGELSVPPRDLAALILKHRHNTVKAKTVNQDTIEFEHSDQFYWAVNENTLLGHQMPIAVVGMRPTAALSEPTTFWDWGLIYDFCPDKSLNVLGDSDEFLMLEMRPQMRSAEHILLGRSSPKLVAKRMTGYITQYQLDSAKFPLTLHSEGIPTQAFQARTLLKTYVETVLSNLPKKPIEHSNHVQWRYHARYFRQRLAKRHFTRALHRVPNSRNQKSRKKGQQVVRAMTAYQRPLGRQAAFFQRVGGIVNPYRGFMRHLFRENVGTHVPHILAVCESGSSLLRFLDRVPGLQTHLTPDLILEGALEAWPRKVSRFDFCIIEAPIGEFASRAVDVLEVLIPHITEGGTMSLAWNAAALSNPQIVTTAAVKMMSRHPFDVDFERRSSTFAAWALQASRASSAFSQLGRLGSILRAVSLRAAALLLLLGRLAAGRRGETGANAIRSLDSRCATLIINLRPNRLGSSAGMYVDIVAKEKKPQNALSVD